MLKSLSRACFKIPSNPVVLFAHAHLGFFAAQISHRDPSHAKLEIPGL